MSEEDREAIRKAGAEDARRSRAEHGFPERIEDPAAIAVLAAILRGARKRAPPSESTSNERNPSSITRKAAETGHRDRSPPLLACEIRYASRIRRAAAR